MVDALQMAIARRKAVLQGWCTTPTGEFQYTSLSFGKCLEDEELVPSMGWVGTTQVGKAYAAVEAAVRGSRRRVWKE